METINWSSLKGKNYRICVGKTSAEAVAASKSEYIFFTTDGNIVMNGVKFVPTVQTSSNGNNKQYIYSDETDERKDVLCGVYKVYQNGGKLKICHKIWGTDNSNYDDGKMHTKEFPVVNTSSDGAADHYVHARLINNTLYEGASTTDAVVLNYTNFAASGNKTIKLTAATSAKAGCMTVAHVNELNRLSKCIVELGDFSNESKALDKMKEISVCANKEIVHAHITYSISEGSSIKNNIILIQSISGNYCRQFIFNKDKIMQRGITFTDENRTTIAQQEDFNFIFGDRLVWDKTNNKYVLSQFGVDFNNPLNEPIPTATIENDGLMSKEDKALLMKVKEKLEL